MANTGTRVRRVLRGQALLARLLWECSPTLTTVAALAAVAQAVAAAGVMVGSGRLVAALEDGQLDTHVARGHARQSGSAADPHCGRRHRRQRPAGARHSPAARAGVGPGLTAARDRAPRGRRHPAVDRRRRRGDQPAVLPRRAEHLAGHQLPPVGRGRPDRAGDVVVVGGRAGARHDRGGQRHLVGVLAADLRADLP